MTDKNSFLDFLKFTSGQKEVSLVIAENEQEQRTFREILHEQHFRQIIDGSELISLTSSPTKIFFQIDHILPKVVYDFAIQYPTGQIEQFDRSERKSDVVSPTYKDSSFILLVTKDTLEKVEKEGFQLLQSAGLTFRS